ncbi:hypothetical protein EYF80_054982 [Liparis tanakae]|uniref:Uncharacterized protein n=1 Tax=Liparis tanakae TaxID=230148 RepID=A0A4Z2F1U9_9TELE|nr:hypothetical protein EYF80_054982 [Liparis tanakae]
MFICNVASALRAVSAQQLTEATSLEHTRVVVLLLLFFTATGPRLRDGASHRRLFCPVRRHGSDSRSSWATVRAVTVDLYDALVLFVGC